VAYLALAVDTHDAAGGRVLGGDEDSLRRDAVHVDAHARLDLVQVHVAVLGHDVDDAVFGRRLKRTNLCESLLSNPGHYTGHGASENDH
jgi:hypothetical protein